MSKQQFSTLDDVRAEMDEISELIGSSEFLKELKSKISEYQGLNVLPIANQIRARAAAARSNCLAMIMLFLCRGNNIGKMVIRTTDKGRVRITELNTTCNRTVIDGKTAATLE